MSKKHRQARKSFPWPIVTFGAIVLAAAIFLLAGKAGGGNGSSGGTGSPEITADPAQVDYGYVKFGNDKTIRIKVTNTGGGVLRFSDKPYIEVLEGC